MIVVRLEEAEPIDVGKLLGIPDMGATIRWLIHNGVGDERYRHRFALRHYTVQPDKEFPMHSHKYVEAAHILSGRARFEGDKETAELGPGDTIYTYEDEPHRGVVLGDEPLELLCVIDCIDGGENCVPGSQQAAIRVER